MPPIANHGTVSVAAAARSELEAACDRVLLRRRRERRHADVVGAGDVAAAPRRSRPRARPAGPARRAPAPRSTGMSLRPTWTPSAPHASTRSGRSLRTNSAPCSRAGRTERLGRGDERLVVELLVAQLDDVDAAAQRRLEQRTRILAVRPGLEDEIEARAGESLASHARLLDVYSGAAATVGTCGRGSQSSSPCSRAIALVGALVHRSGSDRGRPRRDHDHRRSRSPIRTAS